MISPGRLWRDLRRDLTRGFAAARHHYATLPRITEWSWPYWAERPNAVPVHVLTGQEDWLLAAWMLASWFHFTQQGWHVVVHDDGSLSDEAMRILSRMFPGARIIRRAEADSALERALLPYPYCLDYRRTEAVALKVFDAHFFAEGDRFIMIDSNVLFFQRPDELIDWTAAESHNCWFNEDVREMSLISEEEASSELGVTPWSRVNTGLCLLSKEAFDFDFCDRILARTSVGRGETRRIEQTLLALCAARRNKGGLLPRKYEVSLRKHASPDAVSRHYLAAVRNRFYGEGLKRLRGELLLPAE